MNTLIPQLIELLKQLEPAPGAPANALRDLLRAVAASILQHDPAQANIPPGDLDPRVVEAIQAGIEQAAVLQKTFTRLRIALEVLLAGTSAAHSGEQVSEIFGPFVQRSGRLLRFTSFRSGAFLGLTVPLVQPNINEDLVAIPAASTPDAPDLQNWTLAPGTVWINSRFLVPGATGFTGLRIAGGTLQVAAGTFKFRSGIVIPPLSVWSLSVEPEAAPPAGAGSDGDALSLTVPTRLEVHSNAPPVISGAPVLSGFGSDLHFTFSGSPFFDGSQISFPMLSAEPTWSIGGNTSALATFSGDSPVGSANFVLPVSATPIEFLAEATHSGSLVVRLNGGLISTFASQKGGPSNWFVSILTANAQRLELEGLQADSAARYDFDLWNTSSSSLQFARHSISLLFRSERGTIDTAVIFGGAIGDKWDLPCAADGRPFPFQGAIDSFGLLSNPGGSWVTISATAPPPAFDPLHGLVLENLYLLVRAPRKLFALSPFDTPPLLSSGIAILLFDVTFAIATLPDPYATNLPLPHGQGGIFVPIFPPDAADALGIHLAWEDAATPKIRTYLEPGVQFLEPVSEFLGDQEERAVLEAFHTFIASKEESLYLLDMSSREHLLGVAIEAPSHIPADLVDNRLAFPMRNVRLLMQPQVQWEPVQVEPNPDLPPFIPPLFSEIVHSSSNGGRTLIGANSVTLVPALPESLTAGILDAIGLKQPTAALFSLPFGLRAMTPLSPPDPAAIFLHRPDALTSLHEPAFDSLAAARQFRIVARNNLPPLAHDPSRALPGIIRQLANLEPNKSLLTSVTPPELMPQLETQFAGFVPLQHADLSGYGLSSFSQWSLVKDGVGFNKVEFQVLNGRTAYEVLQFRSILYECGARVVRTVTLDRHTSGRVFRSDSGWVAVDPGLFMQPIPFVTGSVRSFQNIRRIRNNGKVQPLIGGAAVQPVLFDADVVLLDHAAPVPIYDRPGYIQVQSAPPAPIPPNAAAPLTDAQLKDLFDRVGPIGGPIDCVLRLGKTLEMQLSSIVSDVALNDAGNKIGFAVAVVGSPKLPRAGQWNVVRIDPATREVSPVDPRRGAPVVLLGSAFRFREPSDALRDHPRIQHGLLMSTESSRVLFPQPFVSIDNIHPANTLQFDLPPIMADPYSLIQSTGHFPRPASAIGLKEKALFHIADDNHWRIDAPEFTVDTTPSAGLMKGGDWAISRGYLLVPPAPPPPPAVPVVPPTTVKLNIDSAAAVALNVSVPRSNLNLDLPAPLNSILKIHTNYETVAGELPRLATPTLEFSGALDKLTDILNSLSQLLNLPFEFKVTVTSTGGASPSFVVHMHLDFRLGKSPEDRVDVGMGKFYGEFTVNGELEASLTGVNRAVLSLEFKGDMQQGILPPLLYAGGLFRFRVELRDTGSPTIELGLGVIFSIGGDLIPGLIGVEATVHYGYTLIPETLDPGALIGLDAHANLLDGLIGFSFAVEAMARIRRKTEDRGIVTIWAQIRVAASVQIAFFIDEDIDFSAQFQQDIPLAALSLIPGVGILPAAASVL